MNQVLHEPESSATVPIIHDTSFEYKLASPFRKPIKHGRSAPLSPRLLSPSHRTATDHGLVLAPAREDGRLGRPHGISISGIGSADGGPATQIESSRQQTHGCPLSQTRPTARSIPDGTATVTAIGSCLSPLDTESPCFCVLESGRCKRRDRHAGFLYLLVLLYLAPTPRSCIPAPVRRRSGATSQTRGNRQSICKTSYWDFLFDIAVCSMARAQSFRSGRTISHPGRGPSSA